MKISQLAKDLKLKNKDILDILTENGIEGKTHSMGLDDAEFSVVFNAVTKKSTATEADFFSYDVEAVAKAAADKEAAEKAAKTAKKTEEKTEAKKEAKAEAKAEAKPEAKAEVKPEVKAEVKPEAKTEAKPEVKAEAKPEPKPEVKKEERPADNTNGKPFEKKPYGDRPQGDRPYNGERKPYGDRPQGDRPYNGERKPYGDRPQGDRPAYGERKPYGDRPQGDRPAYGERKPYGDRPQGDRPAYGERKPYGDRPQGDRPAYGEKKPYGDKPQGGSFGGGFGGGFGGDKGGFGGGFGGADKFGKKPQNGKNDKRGGGFGGMGKEDEDGNQSVRQPSIKPVFDKDGRAQSRYKSENVEKKSFDAETEDGNVRLVDLRAGEVDLSKYDEKYDNLAGVVGYDENAPKKKNAIQNSQKNAQKGQNGKNGKNDFSKGEQNFRGKDFKKDKNNKKGRGSVPAEPPKKFTGPVTIPDEIMISDLAATLRITTGEVVKKLLMMGLDMASVGANKIIDFDTAYLVADELGIVAEREVVVTLEEKLFAEEEETDDMRKTRSPVVCVMGHVDHGKTSLLDAIRDTHVTSGEAGGITQHIGAYMVNINDRDITFLDTPGHEAFTAMRARGAQATDIAILVVAADDGIMPQTVEAINHAKAAGIQVIVAINKMDKPTANPDRVKQELVNYELLPEDWGGDTICVPVSALKREGIDELLEMVLLVADMKDLKANPDKAAKGIVIEAKLDKGRGSVATILVQDGTLHAGDIVIAGMATGRVRAMTNDRGETVKVAGPSVPVEIIGLNGVPDAGDEFRAVADEKMARELVEKRIHEAKEAEFKANSKVSLEDLFSQINEGAKELTIIVKADVQGSAEAVKSSLEKLSNEEVKVRVIHSAVGGINESDVMLADASNAIIVGFNVRPDKNATDKAERSGVDIRTYRVIYDIIEEVKAALCGMLAPEFKEVVLGHAEVRQTIHVPGVGTIAGSYITDGKVARNAEIRVVRDGIVIFEDKISSLKRFKDDAKEVAQGYECGIGLEHFNDIKEGDILEAFIMEEVERKLESVKGLNA
ncbi:MAG: translation initiation factor IF-2 [Clostridia bacterium]|nr:translation initiation factor IF-2 [Clostridia bacterium]